MTKTNFENLNDARTGERGAALLTTLLVTTLLMIIGTALVLATAMSARNAIDATPESQAYYGAEAGLQAALHALRGNKAPTATAMPAGMTGINFRNAVTRANSNDCPSGNCTSGDPSTVARLSRWLPYTNTQAANTRVTISTNPLVEYDVTVSLPPGDVMPAAPIEPNRVLVQATGYGPKNSIKRLQMIVARNSFDPTVPAMMTLIGSPGGSTPMTFNSGNSANHVYSGLDHGTPPNPTLPAFGVTDTSDLTIATNSAASNTTSSPAAGVVSASGLPAYLRTANAARSFLTTMQQLAIQGQANGTATYLASGGSGLPSGFTFVNGDYTISPGNSSGLLIVTGDLNTNGATNFSGLILVLGHGSLNRNGGGGGYVYGATFVANFDWPTVTNPNFQAPYFNFNGAGNATMQYDSTAVANALQTVPFPVLGVSEY